jgi:DNA-binding NtrC family response regulator
MTASPPTALRITDESYVPARDRILAEFERAYLADLLDRAGDNLSEAARIAGVDRTSIYRLMERHGLKRTYTVAEQPEQPEPAAFTAGTEPDDTK